MEQSGSERQSGAIRKTKVIKAKLNDSLSSDSPWTLYSSDRAIHIGSLWNGHAIADPEVFVGL